MQLKTLLATSIKNLDGDEASLEVNALLQHTLQVNRAWLIAHADDAISEQDYNSFQALLKRRIQGEPIAYILGEREFFGLPLKVSADTLIPRSDTETLVEVVLEKFEAQMADPALTPALSLSERELNVEEGSSSFPQRRESKQGNVGDEGMDSRLRGNDAASVLDLGTGTGAIALAVAKHRPNTQITAVDFSAGALKIAQENASNLDIENVTFLQSNWFDALTNQRFDMIVSNPPYIEENDPHLSQGDLRFEPRTALASGADGLDDIRHIISQAKDYLKPNGCLLFEHGYNQAEAVEGLLSTAGFSDIETIKDLGGNDRVTTGTLR